MQTALPRPLLYLLLSSLVILLTLGVAQSVQANMDSPHLSGDLVVEPIGDFKQLSITEERLLFDLRPLDQDDGDLRINSAKITAAYQVRNAGNLTTVDLLFVAPGIVTSSVTVDNQPILAQVTNPRLPASWQAPQTVPSIGQGSVNATQNAYSVNGYGETGESVQGPLESNRGLQFAVTLPPGDHTIQVSYTMQPGSYDATLYRDYQIGYVLAPAKSWAAFGSLNLEV